MSRATSQTNFPRSSTLVDEKGFTLVEVIVSLVVMSIIFLFLAKIYAVGTGHTVKQGDRRKASFLAQEILEGISAQQFSTIASATPVSGLTTTNVVSGYSFFNQTIMQDYVQDNDFTTIGSTYTNAIRIGVIISSAKGYQGFQDVSLQNVITNWQRKPN